MYQVASSKAEEFIHDGEIVETLAYARENRANRPLIEAILQKAAEGKGVTHREAAVLLECELEDLNQRMFTLAKQIKEKIYGNRIVMFAPLYLSNYCINGCVYCPYHQKNKTIPRRKLTQEEIRREVIALQDMGHKRLALEAGEDPRNNPIEYILESIKTIYSVHHKNGAIRRVNVNIAATTVENYRKLRDAGIGTYILFQETYNKTAYEALHPTGPKSDYAYHTEAMDRAMEGGIDDVGIGVLFGLNTYRYDFTGLLMHAEHLEARFGVGPHTISVPRICPADDIDTKDFPDAISDEIFRKIVAVIRIAVPLYWHDYLDPRIAALARTGAGNRHFTDQRRLAHQRRRLRRNDACRARFRTIRRERPPYAGRSGALAAGTGLRAELLHGLLPRRPHGRPLHVAGENRKDRRLLHAQRPDDPQGVPRRLRIARNPGLG